MDLNYMQRRTWAEIDIDALEYNYKTLRKITPQTAKICCIIKADAYGHGAVPVGKLYEKLGADFLAVSNIEEAMTVRKAGIKLPLLILGYTHPSCAEILAENDISQCVYSYEYGKALEEKAKEYNVRLAIHLKLDVGMGRIGFVIDNSNIFSEALEICKSPMFRTEGIFTHFPMADEGEKGEQVTLEQYKRFCSFVNAFENEGISFEIKHCNNSAATIKFPQISLDMVRVGVSLYGIAPLEKRDELSLKNTLSLKTVISHIKTLKKGDTVGYGSEYVADKETVIATLPIGYADGFKRENSFNGTRVWVNGHLCPITGRICMDQTMIDITGITASVDDEVIIYGGDSSVSLDDFSINNRKIPYETMCEISARVPRAYCKNGKISFVRDSLV